MTNRFVRPGFEFGVKFRKGHCCRCKKAIEGFRAAPGLTAGYYLVGQGSPWQKYANPGEVQICDRCMWSDQRYIAEYGEVE